jgi:exodeoxyribonuclease VII large subunit
VKPEPIEYGDRKVYSVAAFNRGVASWIARLPTVWVEGEITELRRQPGRPTVFFTLRDAEDGSSLAVTIPRPTFDALRLDLVDGVRVHVFGRPELWSARASFRLRARTLEPVGLGDVLARLEQLRRKLAGEGLFAAERKRPLPLLPARIGLVTGTDAAAKGDVIAAIHHRFPPARLLVAETTVQGPRAAAAIVDALRAICRSGVDVIVLARGGGSFDDLLPFSDERVVRAVASCPVPIVSAVGHEQDNPLCDLAADTRASTPTAAVRLVVPDLGETSAALDGLHERLTRGGLDTLGRARRQLERDRLRLVRAPALLLERKRAGLAAGRARLTAAPPLFLERRRAGIDALGGRLHAVSPHATLQRGYAVVRSEGRIVRRSASVAPGGRIDVELAEGALAATVEEIRR